MDMQEVPQVGILMQLSVAHHSEVFIPDILQQQQHPRRVDSIRNPHQADSELRDNTPRKRSYGDRKAEQTLSGHEYEEDGSDNGEVSHASKRNKNLEWPLSPSPSNGKSMSPAPNFSRRPVSPDAKRPRPGPTRASKFSEGSMNNRTSARPPSPYLNDEPLVIKDDGNMVGIRASLDSQLQYDAGIESSRKRPSSMYRFGRALANAFNPSVVWQSVHGLMKERQETTTTTISEFEDRKAQADSAYAELKKSRFAGIFGASSQNMLRGQLSVLSFGQTDSEHAADLAHPRDSGIELKDDQASRDSREEKNGNGGSAALPATLIEASAHPPLLAKSGRSVSPASESAQASKVRKRMRRSSLATIKKVKSHLAISSLKNELLTPHPALPTETSSGGFGADDAAVRGARESALQRKKSRKSLHTQQKLNKKISNLESELEKARRLYYEASQGEPPVPTIHGRRALRPFVPGRLASLPSERILHSQQKKHAEGDNPKLREHLAEPTERPEEANITPKASKMEAKEHIASKLVGTENELTPRADLRLSSTENMAKTSTRTKGSKDSRAKPGKAAANDVSQLSGKRDPSQSIHTASYELKSSSASSGPSVDDGAPPVPPKDPPSPLRSPSSRNASSPSTFDASKHNIDIPYLLSLRRHAQPDMPFGFLAEDILHFRATYPPATINDVVEYVAAATTATNSCTAVPPVPCAPPTTPSSRIASPRRIVVGARSSSIPTAQLHGPHPVLSPRQPAGNVRGATDSPAKRVTQKKSSVAAPRSSAAARGSPRRENQPPQMPSPSHDLKAQRAELKRVAEDDFVWDDEVF